MSDRIYNFSAGPAVLPEPVLRKAQDALWNFEGTGIGIMEHSHRGVAFTRVLEQTEAACRELMSVPDTYRVLFLQGGASTQFFMAPMNLLREADTADYVNTGEWSKKAIKEAARFATVHVAASSEDGEFTFIPGADQTTWSEAPKYVHYTSNNTIFGTQFRDAPSAPAGVPLVCDASSDVFSRPVDIPAHGLFYAGAQKNLGPSGVTLVILRGELCEQGNADLPIMLQYRTHADADSCFNTPPTFAIYVVGEVLGWLREFGGLAAIDEYNRAKANKLYDFIDDSAMFSGTARADSRSLMNVCFRAARPQLESAFIAQAEGRGLSGLKGHRSVGGMRASIYNAFPAEGVDALIAFMKEFERANA